MQVARVWQVSERGVVASVTGRSHRLFGALLAVWVLLLGCTPRGSVSFAPATVKQSAPFESAGEPATPSADVTPAPAPTARVGTYNGLPVDPSLTPVSRSSPAPEAARALEACVPEERTPVPSVAGMARVPARDVPRYVAIGVVPPDLDRDDPVWVLQLRGEVTDPRAQLVLVDPACVYVDGGGGMYAVGGTRPTAGGALETFGLGSLKPEAALPSLAP